MFLKNREKGLDDIAAVEIQFSKYWKRHVQEMITVMLPEKDRRIVQTTTIVSLFASSSLRSD